VCGKMKLTVEVRRRGGVVVSPTAILRRANEEILHYDIESGFVLMSHNLPFITIQ
jgi:hypothetical protein